MSQKHDTKLLAISLLNIEIFSLAHSAENLSSKIPAQKPVTTQLCEIWTCFECAQP